MVQVPTAQGATGGTPFVRGANLQQIKQPDRGAAVSDVGASFANISLGMAKEEQQRQKELADAAQKRQEREDKSFIMDLSVKSDAEFRQKKLDSSQGITGASANQKWFNGEAESIQKQREDLAKSIEREDLKLSALQAFDKSANQYLNFASGHVVSEGKKFQRDTDLSFAENAKVNAQDVPFGDIEGAVMLIGQGNIGDTLTGEERLNNIDQGLTSVWQQWMSVDTASAVALWDKRKDEMQQVMGSGFTTINNLVESKRDPMQLTRANAELNQKFNSNPVQMSNYLKDPEHIESLGLTFTQAQTLKRSYDAEFDRQRTIANDALDAKIEEQTNSIYKLAESKKFTAAGILLRESDIPGKERAEIELNLQRQEFRKDPIQVQAVYRDIDKLRITKKSQITSRLGGGIGDSTQPYMDYLEEIQGINHNYYNDVDEIFRLETNDDDNLKKFKSEFSLMVRQEAASQKLTAGDPKILGIARDILEKGRGVHFVPEWVEKALGLPTGESKLEKAVEEGAGLAKPAIEPISGEDPGVTPGRAGVPNFELQRTGLVDKGGTKPIPQPQAGLEQIKTSLESLRIKTDEAEMIRIDEEFNNNPNIPRTEKNIKFVLEQLRLEE